ncbi:HNH endonuclease [Mycolicibacterium cyprinidarum]|uniref:HNH endonuclease n=1 Tax=Mycolicibacterium cyprinidarum TaxID=2860311 RepID=A0ABQ4VBR2_9MYCO|nr:HNH endonuclease [Mycolicibacterium sp. NGTWSNA01]
MSGVAVHEAVAALRGAHDALAASDIEALPFAELVAVMDELEALSCQLPMQSHRMLTRLQFETTPKAMGAKSWKDVLAIRWRISTGEATRRLAEAAELGPRRALIGEALAPILPATAAAQAVGLINAEHVKVLRDAMKNLPGFVDTTTREQIEVDLVRKAVGVGPKALKKAADRVLFLLDQDGPVPDDTERARRRGLQTRPQGRDGMRPFAGNMTPEAWATWEAIFAKYAAPGMCNPDDPEPCISATPSQEQIDNDHRSLAQRQHDALVAVGRMALMSGQLGQLNGLPVSIIIRTTLQDLESRAGVGTTGGGSVMPIKDVIRLAAHANHHLAVFDKATGSAMDLFRARRTASPGQRVMLIARDGGCTKPCCTVGAYGSQVHHALRDWSDGGQTNVDELALACGPDNRLVDKRGGWTTTINGRGEVEWIPPPQLDTGQGRLNYYHRPEALLRPSEYDPPPCALSSPIDADESPFSEPDQNASADHEPFDPRLPAADDQADGGKRVRGP